MTEKRFTIDKYGGTYRIFDNGKLIPIQDGQPIVDLLNELSEENKQLKQTIMEFTSKKQIASAIKEQITTNKRQAINALFRIFEYQTADEQKSGDVSSLNGVGFVGCDSEILTSFCKHYRKYGCLSDKQMEILFKKIGKYAGQLTKQAIKNGLYVKEGGLWVVAKK